MVGRKHIGVVWADDRAHAMSFAHLLLRFVGYDPRRVLFHLHVEAVA